MSAFLTGKRKIFHVIIVCTSFLALYLQYITVNLNCKQFQQNFGSNVKNQALNHLFAIKYVWRFFELPLSTKSQLMLVSLMFYVIMNLSSKAEYL